MRRENIYKHVTSGQEFISQAYMRRELYKRIKIAHDYMVHADKQYYRGEINLNCFLEKINERIAELQYCIWFSEDALIISPEESDSFHEFINKFTLMFVGHCEYVFVKDIFPMEVFDILLSPVLEG